jgi:hypothetical protein
MEEWVTKQEFMALTGKSEKTVERYVNAGFVRREQRETHEGKFPVFSRADIEKLTTDTKLRIRTPVVLKTAPRAKRPSVDRHSDDVTLPAIRPSSPLTVVTPPSVPLERKLFLTVKEASFFSGLTIAYLERAIDDRRLPVVKDKSRKIFRRHLLQFCAAVVAGLEHHS